MSLPRELLDQLLSGYLDDALSPDERARVEQLLQSNPETVNELAQLGSLRQSLKAVARADSVIKLDDRFADRVLGAAIARARAEGLGDDHPLVRLSEQPSTTRPATGSSSWRVASVWVGLAASIALAVFALRPDVPEPERAIAKVQPQNPELIAGLSPELSPGPVVGPELAAQAPNVEPDKIAATAPGPSAPVAPMDPVADPPSATPPMKQPAPTSLAEAIARSTTRGADPIAPPAVANIERPTTRLGMVLVVDVRRSEAGRQTNAVGRAMEKASLAAASQKTITDEIVAVARQATDTPADGEEVSVFFLQSSAKKLDQFYLALQADMEGIESVRLAFTMNAPILEAARAVSPDPTMVRHDDASLELFSESGVVSDFAQQLGELPFGKNQRGQASEIPSIGPDVSAQMLVLVR